MPVLNGGFCMKIKFMPYRKQNEREFYLFYLVVGVNETEKSGLVFNQRI